MKVSARLRVAGEKLIVFETNDWLYDRWPPWNERRAGKYENYRTTLEPLRPNPKVRTLALALLFDNAEPKLLPHLAYGAGHGADGGKAATKTVGVYIPSS